MRVRLITMSAGRITHSALFEYSRDAFKWTWKTFPECQLVNVSNFSATYKSGETPINIIIAPVAYMQESCQ